MSPKSASKLGNTQGVMNAWGAEPGQQKGVSQGVSNGGAAIGGQKNQQASNGNLKSYISELKKAKGNNDRSKANHALQ
jgi:hypothetical protein